MVGLLKGETKNKATEMVALLRDMNGVSHYAWYFFAFTLMQSLTASFTMPEKFPIP